MSKETILIPVVSEKVYGVSASLNRFAFKVAKNINKHEVARAVEAQYGVTVTSVSIINQVGKKTRTYRNKRSINGARSDYKKAYVTVKAGQSLPIFAAVEEEIAAETKTAAVKKESPKKTGLLKRKSSKKEDK